MPAAARGMSSMPRAQTVDLGTTVVKAVSQSTFISEIPDESTSWLICVGGLLK